MLQDHKKMAKNNFENIGILGGSFDPPHRGHLYVSKKSIKLLKLKKVIWAITKKNPFKKKSSLDLANRIKICKKILKKIKRMKSILLWEQII